MLNCSLHLMRHAQSQHNIAKEEWEKNNPNLPNPKETKEYEALKYSPSLIDPHILLHSQVEQKKKELDLNSIDVIICSPLRRCLQTCAKLLEGHSRQIKVIIEPLMSSRLNSAWSIGSSINMISKEFPNFDYSAFIGIEETWNLKYLEKTRKLQEKQVQQNAHRSQSFLLETLSTKKGESYFEFRERISCLRNRLRVLLEKNLDHQKEGRALLIAHSCVLNFLTAKDFTEKGKVKNKVGFPYCSPKQFDANDILQAGDMENLNAKL